tara:strand:+ start:2162 stop:2590 length:429 start_codon:yes stop_codon:yes gene_type:complete
MIDKIHKQIIELERRGYRRSEMRIRGTRPAVERLERMYRRQMGSTFPPRKKFERFDGVQIDLMEGILETIYVWVPVMQAEIRKNQDHSETLLLIDADRRILDECLLEVRKHLIKFTPENVSPIHEGRVDITARIDFVRMMSQ